MEAHPLPWISHSSIPLSVQRGSMWRLLLINICHQQFLQAGPFLRTHTHARATRPQLGTVRTRPKVVGCCKTLHAPARFVIGRTSHHRFETMGPLCPDLSLLGKEISCTKAPGGELLCGSSQVHRSDVFASIMINKNECF